MHVRTRFAPSPTGPLHLGHAYAAMFAHDLARAAGGDFLIRIEDIDRDRSRPEWQAAILNDLAWLRLCWETPVMRQSDRIGAYEDALDTLWARGLLYPCTCTRRDICEALSAPQEGAAPAMGPDGPVYPGTCRPRATASSALTRRPLDRHLRLHLDRAWDELGDQLTFTETGPDYAGTITITHDQMRETVGDIVLARRDMGTSYHLSVVLDDAAQGITHVTRGADLFEATRIHVLVQHLLGLPTPIYHHHLLIRDAHGKRLAKRDDARAIATYRTEGATPTDIRRMVGL